MTPFRSPPALEGRRVPETDSDDGLRVVREAAGEAEARTGCDGDRPWFARPLLYVSVPASTSSVPLFETAMLELIACDPATLSVSAPRFVSTAVPLKKSSGVAELLASSIVPPAAFVRLFAPPLENPNKTRSSPATVNVPSFVQDVPPISDGKPPAVGTFTVVCPCVVNDASPRSAVPLPVTSKRPVTVTGAVPASVLPRARGSEPAAPPAR